MTWKDLLSKLADLLRKPADNHPPAPTPPTPPPEVQTDPETARLLELHLKARNAVGLWPLTTSQPLTEMAEDYAKQLAKAGRLTHELTPDQSFSSRLRRSGYPAIAAGENIAAGYPNAGRVFGGWLSSPGHRANIMNPVFRECGFGYADAPNGVRYWCAVLGTVRRTASSSANERTQCRIGQPATLWIDVSESVPDPVDR